jgi:hypothetical protein
MDGEPPIINMEVPNQPVNKHMSEKTRNDVFLMLVQISENGVLPHGAITRVADQFLAQRSSVSRLWKQACSKRAAGLSISEAIAKKSKKGIYPVKYIPELISAQISQIPIRRRKTIRDAIGDIAINLTSDHAESP